MFGVLAVSVEYSDDDDDDDDDDGCGGGGGWWASVKMIDVGPRSLGAMSNSSSLTWT